MRYVARATIVALTTLLVSCGSEHLTPWCPYTVEAVDASQKVLRCVSGPVSMALIGPSESPPADGQTLLTAIIRVGLDYTVAGQSVTVTVDGGKPLTPAASTATGTFVSDSEGRIRVPIRVGTSVTPLAVRAELTGTGGPQTTAELAVALSGAQVGGLTAAFESPNITPLTGANLGIKGYLDQERTMAATGGQVIQACVPQSSHVKGSLSWQTAALDMTGAVRLTVFAEAPEIPDTLTVVVCPGTAASCDLQADPACTSAQVRVDHIGGQIQRVGLRLASAPIRLGISQIVHVIGFSDEFITPVMKGAVNVCASAGTLTTHQVSLAREDGTGSTSLLVLPADNMMLAPISIAACPSDLPCAPVLAAQPGMVNPRCALLSMSPVLPPQVDKTFLTATPTTIAVGGSTTLSVTGLAPNVPSVAGAPVTVCVAGATAAPSRIVALDGMGQWQAPVTATSSGSITVVACPGAGTCPVDSPPAQCGQVTITVNEALHRALITQVPPVAEVGSSKATVVIGGFDANGVPANGPLSVCVSGGGILQSQLIPLKGSTSVSLAPVVPGTITITGCPAAVLCPAPLQIPPECSRATVTATEAQLAAAFVVPPAENRPAIIALSASLANGPVAGGEPLSLCASSGNAKLEPPNALDVRGNGSVTVTPAVGTAGQSITLTYCLYSCQGALLMPPSPGCATVKATILPP